MLLNQINQLLVDSSAPDDVVSAFRQRVCLGALTRDENPVSHFCVYFAAYDPVLKAYFLGRHIKSGLWLFNGGHINPGENSHQAARREMAEEWGEGCLFSLSRPGFFSSTSVEINSPSICKEHFNIWYFIPVDSKTFAPELRLLAQEFDEARWFSRKDALGVISDNDTKRVVIGLDEGSLGGV